MANFKLVIEIELDAENPLDAAKEFKNWVKEEYDFQSYVFFFQNTETKELFSVDLSEDDEDAVLPVDLCDYQPEIEK